MSFIKPDPMGIIKAIDFVDSHFQDLLTVVVTRDNIETIIDTKDKVKLMELCNKKLLKYLFPADNSVENEDAGFTQFRDVEAANFKLRTTAMFFEWEIMQAKKCQAVFNETRYERPVHLIYYSILQDWIDFMEELFAEYKEKELLCKTEKNKRQEQEANHSYSHKQIAIAYCIMGISITPENAFEILKEHSLHKSASTLLRKRISKTSELTKISENKTADTKHLNDLKAAKRLMSGKKNKKAERWVNDIITAFQTAYNKKYQN